MKEKCENVCELDEKFLHLEKRVTTLEEEFKPFNELKSEMELLKVTVKNIENDVNETTTTVKQIKKDIPNFKNDMNKQNWSFRVWVLTTMILIITTTIGIAWKGLDVWNKSIDVKFELLLEKMKRSEIKSAIPYNTNNNNNNQSNNTNNTQKKD